MIRIRHVSPAGPAARAAILLLAIAVPMACSSPGPATSDDTPTGPSTALSEALAFVPADTSYFALTDWLSVKSATGHRSVTSAASNAERHTTYTDIYADQATASRFASDTITFDLGSTIGSPPPAGPSNQARTWGFDALDLRWDASVFEPGAQAGVMILRLRQGFDFEALKARFDQRGFRNEQIAGLTVRDLGGSAPGANAVAVETAMSNTAFLSDDKTIAISNSLAELTAYLQALKSHASADVTLAAAQLDNPWAVALLAGQPACGYFDPPAGYTLDQSFAASLNRQIKGVGPLMPFQVVAIGYHGTPTLSGHITFIYGQVADAVHDLVGREDLAKQGFRLADRQTYASTVFSVTGARTSDRALDLDVAPVGGKPIQLFEAFAGRDLVPAICQQT